MVRTVGLHCGIEEPGLGTRETRSNDLLSLMMFQTDYIQRLIEMGEADAAARLPDFCASFK